MRDLGEHFVEACVNGRFQPPHRGHLEYILEAKKRCDFLWIGITRFDSLDETPCEKATHRATAESNPLTYFERVQLLTRILESEGVPRGAFGFVPFPIDQPTKLSQFIPPIIPIFTTIYDEWNRHKISLLESAGYRVVVLWERNRKEFSGHAIRESMRNGSDAWRQMLPPAAVPLADSLDLVSRVIAPKCP